MLTTVNHDASHVPYFRTSQILNYIVSWQLVERRKLLNSYEFVRRCNRSIVEQRVKSQSHTNIFIYTITCLPFHTVYHCRFTHSFVVQTHYSDIIMGAMAFKITTVSIVYNRLFRRRSKKTSELCVTGLCEGNSPVTGEFPTKRAINAKNASIWWRHRAPWNNKIVRKRMRFFEDKLCLKMCLPLQFLVYSNHFFSFTMVMIYRLVNFACISNKL